MNGKTTAALVVTAVFAFLRFFLPSSGALHPEDIFKDLAHIWVGILFGVGLSRAMASAKDDTYYDRANHEGTYLILAVVLTIVEVAAFFMSRHS